MSEIQLMPIGVTNLDAVLGGGIPVYLPNMLADAPGSGQTILAQQILFSFIQQDSNARALYLSTLSEPSMKVVRYMQYFDFFDAVAFEEQVLYYALGELRIENNLSQVSQCVLDWVSQNRATISHCQHQQKSIDLSESNKRGNK